MTTPDRVPAPRPDSAPPDPTAPAAPATPRSGTRPSLRSDEPAALPPGDRRPEPRRPRLRRTATRPRAVPRDRVAGSAPPALPAPPEPHRPRARRRTPFRLRTVLGAAALSLLAPSALPAQPGPPTLPGSDPFGNDPFGDLRNREPDADIEAMVRTALFARNGVSRNRALSFLIERNERDVVPAFIAVLRVLPDEDGRLLRALQRLARARIGRDWKAWTEWQETHSEIRPFDGFDAFKADVLAGIDPAFRDFVHRGVKHEIRLEEIVWGGVTKDGIPALTNPKHIPAAEADYLTDRELVFGVSLNGDARAYPLRILDWHEMFNDVVGGIPVSLAYCTLCGSGILFDGRVAGYDEPFVFGSSGLLYRSNKLMYDERTESLWNQFTGRPVVGELTGSGIELRVLPVVITSWASWRADHPDTTALSLDTGYRRDYRPGRPYGEYFASPDLMFPVVVRDRRLDPKDRIFALRAGKTQMAWTLSLFEGGAVLHDRVDDLDLVLVGEAATETVRAYETGGRRFTLAPDADAVLVDGTGARWRITEGALAPIVETSGENSAAPPPLPRLPGHLAYWFAWASYLDDRPLRAP